MTEAEEEKQNMEVEREARVQPLLVHSNGKKKHFFPNKASHYH